MLIIPIVILFFFATGMVMLGYFLSGPKYLGPVSDHFDGKKFFTPGGRPAKELGDALQWMLKRSRGPWPKQALPEPGEKPESQVYEGIHITFVNHSTFLIQADGINILTDPVWSDRTSPFQWAGPKRMRPPGIRLEDLPRIDVVLLSHNHYDHLDFNSLKSVFEKHQPKIVTPLGVRAYLDKYKIRNAIDLDWWEALSISDALQIQSVPAQHFSGRGMADRDATLWCGYVIKRSGGNIYFVGDTGYHLSMFKEIGDRCAPIQVALVPIGAYKPEWFMSAIHCSPQEAVRIHLESKSRQSIATHFGTFPLADDGLHEPAAELQKALVQNGLEPEQFIVMKEGEVRKFQDGPA
jgi:L-ascorbate metabolism protein UlaG (beta-lactamase superfamily)